MEGRHELFAAKRAEWLPHPRLTDYRSFDVAPERTADEYEWAPPETL